MDRRKMDGALTIYNNARELLASSQLLAEHGFYNQAFSLATTGLEEAVKTFSLSLHAMEMLADEDFQEFQKDGQKHKNRQSMSLVIPRLLALAPAVTNALARQGFPEFSLPQVSQVLTNTFQQIRPLMEDDEEGAWDHERMNALYADWLDDEQQVRHITITKARAQEKIQDLEIWESFLKFVLNNLGAFAILFTPFAEPWNLRDTNTLSTDQLLEMQKLFRYVKDVPLDGALTKRLTEVLVKEVKEGVITPEKVESSDS